MTIDRAPFIQGLNETIPANRDPRAEGAGQIRAIKTALKNSFPNVDGEVTANADRMNDVFGSAMPTIGMIMMFGGPNLPEGWAWCDGGIYNNIITPDLRGRFVMGANIAYRESTLPDPKPNTVSAETAVGKNGSSNDETDFGRYITTKDHALTLEEIPAHTHTIPFRMGDKARSSGSQHRVTPSPQTTNSAGGLPDGTTKPHDHDIIHKDSGVIDPSGKPEKVVYDKRPAWYALAYIMFVGVPAA